MFHHTIDWIDDRLNPIVVKEIRQFVNSRGLLGTTFMFLGVELIVLLIMTMDKQSRQTGQGMWMFISIMSILALACVLGVAVPSSLRFHKECSKDSIDLLHTTVISPFRIVLGKIFSSMVMVVFLFSLSLPFMCIAYFMRGISIPVILSCIYTLFICLIPVMSLAALVGSLNLSVVVRGILLVVIIWIGGMLFFGWLSSIRYGFVSYHYTELFFLASIIALSAAGLCCVLGVSSVSHQGSNRMLPVRLYLFVLWMVSLSIILATDYFFAIRSIDDIITMWFIFSMAAMFIVCGTSSAERLEQSPRVLKRIPKRRIFRLLYFLFSTGAVNAIFYSLLIAFSSVVITSVYFFVKNGSLVSNIEIILSMSEGYAYFLFYAGLVIIIRNRLKQVFPKINGFVYFMVLALIFSLAPLLLLLLVYLDLDGVEKHGSIFFIMSPSVMLYSKMRIPGLMVAGIGCAVTTLINMNYYKQYCRLFFKPTSEERQEA